MCILENNLLLNERWNRVLSCALWEQRLSDCRFDFDWLGCYVRDNTLYYTTPRDSKKMILLCLNLTPYISQVSLISYFQWDFVPSPSNNTVQRWHHLHARCATPPPPKAAPFAIQPRIAQRPAKRMTGRSTKLYANLSPPSRNAHQHHTNWFSFFPLLRNTQNLSG
jgi:hypothetical protein